MCTTGLNKPVTEVPVETHKDQNSYLVVGGGGGGGGRRGGGGAGRRRRHVSRLVVGGGRLRVVTRVQGLFEGVGSIRVFIIVSFVTL